MLYRQILDAIEANGYNNFTLRAYVPKWQKMASLPTAFIRAQFPERLLSRRCDEELSGHVSWPLSNCKN